MSRYSKWVGKFIFASLLALPMLIAAQEDDQPAYNLVFGRRVTGLDYDSAPISIYELDTHSGTEKLLLENAANTELIVSPNGEQFLFDSYHVIGCEFQYVCLFDLNTDTLLPLTPNFRLPSSLSWSPDSHQIAFASYYAEKPGIYIHNIATQTDRLIKEYNSNHNNGWVNWSPDSKSISVVWYNRNMQIYDVLSGEAVYQKYVIKYYIGDTPTSWSPSGHQLAVIGLGVYIMDADLNNIESLTPDQSVYISESSLYFMDRVQWLSDESTLIGNAFSYSEEKRYIVSININTLQLQILAEGIKPDLSPDGEWIAFIGEGSLADDVYVMRVDGSDLRQVTHTEVSEMFPKWISKESSTLDN